MTISIYLFDEIVDSPFSIVTRISADLGLECDIISEDLNFRSNDKRKKPLSFARANQDFAKLPDLAPKVRHELKDHCGDGVAKLDAEFGLNVGSWLA